MSQVWKYLQEKGWRYKVASGGQEFQLKTCPLCQDKKWHFYINKNNGVWHCFKCGEKGNLYQLKSRFGDLKNIKSVKDYFSDKEKEKTTELTEYKQYVKNLTKDRKAQKYLTNERGYEIKTIKYFHLGCTKDGWITIPHFREGKIVNIKFRKIEPKKFKRVNGAPTILFNQDNLDFEKPSILLVESETDAIAAWQMGVKNVCSLTAGAGHLKPEWLPIFQKFKKVFICLDSDDPGQKGAYSIAEKIGFQKCFNIILPTKDANDFLLERDQSDFIKEFRNARIFKMQEIKPLGDYMEDFKKWVHNDQEVKGISTGFAQLDDKIGGFKNEDLIIMSGVSGIGKTTISLNLLLNLLKQKRKSLAFLLEGKLSWWISRLMTAHTKKNFVELKNSDDFDEIVEKFSKFPLYFYSGYLSEISPDNLVELAEAAIKLYDIDFLLIDNLQKILIPGKYYTTETAKVISKLKNLAIDAKIPILLICHLRKPDKDSNRKKPQLYDLKSSSNIYQDADMVLILWEWKGKIQLDVLKNRTGPTGKVEMEFNKDIGKFKEI